LYYVLCQGSFVFVQGAEGVLFGHRNHLHHHWNKGIWLDNDGGNVRWSDGGSFPGIKGLTTVKALNSMINQWPKVELSLIVRKSGFNDIKVILTSTQFSVPGLFICSYSSLFLFQSHLFQADWLSEKIICEQGFIPL